MTETAIAVPFANMG